MTAPIDRESVEQRYARVCAERDVALAERNMLRAALDAAEAEVKRLRSGRQAIAAHAVPIKGTPYICGPKPWCDAFDRAALKENPHG